MTVDFQLLKQLKIVELEIFKSFIAVSEKLNLKYYLMDGTLLGAVRHQGFIPWDDDIDVGMMRSDYEIFIANAQDYLPSYYFLQTFQTDPGVLNNFAKIRDSRTTFIETSQKNQKINHGIYIDIFPLDYFPDSEEARRAIHKRNRVLSLRIRKELSLPSEFKGPTYRELLKGLAGTIAKIRYPSPQDALIERNKLYRACDNSGKVINYCGAYGTKSVCPVEWFGDGERISFEGVEAIIPKGWDLYLKQVYGDYMQFPPENKRVPHHYAEIIDPDKSYLEYI
jgi:lipopolysaccharide cholinephosphotransferase